MPINRRHYSYRVCIRVQALACRHKYMLLHPDDLQSSFCAALYVRHDNLNYAPVFGRRWRRHPVSETVHEGFSAMMGGVPWLVDTWLGITGIPGSRTDDSWLSRFPPIANGCLLAEPRCQTIVFIWKSAGSYTLLSISSACRTPVRLRRRPSQIIVSIPDAHLALQNVPMHVLFLSRQ